MAQIGCFIPAEYAAFPLSHELFARVSTDDNIEANVSSFAGEMREMAHILRSVGPKSLVLVDELGRGTSTTDGLSIAIAIAEALIDSRAFVWFVTHFRDLPRILADRAGVSNLHLSVSISDDYAKMTMRYKILEGYEDEKFYGLAIARVLPLPEQVMELATLVSRELQERNEARKRNPRATAVARRRKLILGLREQLGQARERALRGGMERDGEQMLAGGGEDEDEGGGISAEALRMWLKRLQEEFTVRMRAINQDVEEAMRGKSGNERVEDGVGKIVEEDMEEERDGDEEKLEGDDQSESDRVSWRVSASA